MVAPDLPVDTFTLLHAPGHAPDMDESVIERAEATGADIIAWSEAYKIAGRDLHNRPDYRVRVGRSSTDTRLVRSPMGDAGDNPVSVRTRLFSMGKSFKVTDPGPLGRLFKFTPERWLTVVTVELPSGKWVTIIAAHPSPYFAGPRKWRRVMRAALREVHKAKARGQGVILVGDLQTGRATAMLREAGLSVFSAGIDFVAWHGLERLTGSVFNVKPLDHPWVLTEFRVG